MKRNWRKLAKQAKRKRLVVWVLWRDACHVAEGGWVTHSEVCAEIEAPDYRIESVGYLRGVSRKYLTLVQGVSQSNGSCNHLEHIPLSAVIKIRKL